MSSASPPSPPRHPQAPAAAILFARPLPRRREKGRSRLREPANEKAAGAAVHAGSCSPLRLPRPISQAAGHDGSCSPPYRHSPQPSSHSPSPSLSFVKMAPWLNVL